MPLFVVAALAALIAEFWWIIALIAIVTVTVVLIARAVRENDIVNAMVEDMKADLASRADQQHAWTLAGDPRGTYGQYPPADLEGDMVRVAITDRAIRVERPALAHH